MANAAEDSTKAKLMLELLTIYDYHKPEEGLTYKEAALQIANRTKSKIHIARINDKIGRIHWRLGKFSEAYNYHFTALKLYEELGDDIARNYVLVEIGQDYLNDIKFDEAEKYLLKAIELSGKTGDKRGKAIAYNIIIALYENLGNFEKASKAIYESIEACEDLGDKDLLSYAKSSLADYFQAIGNYTEALRYNRESLQLRKDISDLMGQTYSYRSLGDLCLATGNFADAESNYQEAVKISDQMENPWIVRHVLYGGMGNVYLQQGNFNKALHYFLITADELRAIASNHRLASLYAEIGTIYTRLDKYGLAKKYFDSSMALCKKLDTKVPLQNYYNGVHLLDSATRNWKAAYEHFRQYASIKDSTFNKETMRKMMMSQVQYENEKKEAIAKAGQEKKDVQTRGELTRQRNIRNSAFAVLAVVLVFSVIAWRQRNKIAIEKKRSDELVKDKELLLREIHHRVKNNLEIVSSLLALQSARIDDPNTREAMQEGQNRVQSIGIVHQKLYQGENLDSIEMKDYFTNLGESILDSFGAAGRISVEYRMEKLFLDIDTAVPLGLIVNELLTNSLKYAFPDNGRGSIYILLQKQPGAILHLEVGDNGIGKSGITQGTGFGAQLISLLTRQLNGIMKEEISSGTTVIFDFRAGK